MDKFFRQKESDTQQPGGFFISLQIVTRVMKWLAALIHLTEEEQKDAGICYAGDRQRNEQNSFEQQS